MEQLKKKKKSLKYRKGIWNARGSKSDRRKLRVAGKFAFVPRLNSVSIAGLGRKNSAAPQKGPTQTKGWGELKESPGPAVPSH